MSLSREEILGAADLPVQKVPVPEWSPNRERLTAAEQELDALRKVADDETLTDKGLAAIETLEAEIEELDRSVYVRTLTAMEAEESLKGINDDGNFLGRFAALMISDKAGKRLFEDADADALGAKNNAALRRIVDDAEELNGMVAEGDDAEKN